MDELGEVVFDPAPVRLVWHGQDDLVLALIEGIALHRLDPMGVIPGLHDLLQSPQGFVPEFQEFYRP